MATVQVPVPMLGALTDVRDRFFALRLDAGRQVLTAMRRSLDDLPPREEERAVSKSSVSRRFVALTTEAVKRWLGRPLGALDLCVVLIDGIIFHEHCILIALGIVADGTKHVRGLWEGSTENQL